MTLQKKETLLQLQYIFIIAVYIYNCSIGSVNSSLKSHPLWVTFLDLSKI